MVEKQLKYILLALVMLISVQSFSKAPNGCQSTNEVVFSNYLQIYVIPTLFDARKDFIKSLKTSERQRLRDIRKDIQNIINKNRDEQSEVLTLMEILASRWLATELMDLLNKYSYELRSISKSLDNEGQMWKSELQVLMSEGSKNEKRMAKKMYILTSPVSILALDPFKLTKEDSN